MFWQCRSDTPPSSLCVLLRGCWYKLENDATERLDHGHAHGARNGGGIAKGKASSIGHSAPMVKTRRVARLASVPRARSLERRTLRIQLVNPHIAPATASLPFR